MTARAPELVDVSIDIGGVGHAVRDLHERTAAVREGVFKSAEDKLWECEALQTLKLRKSRWKAMQEVWVLLVELRSAACPQ